MSFTYKVNGSYFLYLKAGKREDLIRAAGVLVSRFITLCFSPSWRLMPFSALSVLAVLRVAAEVSFQRWSLTIPAVGWSRLCIQWHQVVAYLLMVEHLHYRNQQMLQIRHLFPTELVYHTLLLIFVPGSWFDRVPNLIVLWEEIK